MLPTKKAGSAVLRLWRIRAAISTLIATLVVVVICLILPFFIEEVELSFNIVAFAAGSFFLAGMLVFVVLIPKIRQTILRYEYRDDEIDLISGLWFTKRTTIPLIRIQNVETTISPLTKSLNLASIEITTAAQKHRLPEMRRQDAYELQQRIQKLIEETLH